MTKNRIWLSWKPVKNANLGLYIKFKDLIIREDVFEKES